MPISREAFNAAPRHEEVAVTIRAFLEGHPDQAYTDAEILEAMPRPDGAPHPAGIHYAVQEALKDLVRVGAVQHRKVGGIDYYMAELPRA